MGGPDYKWAAQTPGFGRWTWGQVAWQWSIRWWPPSQLHYHKVTPCAPEPAQYNWQHDGWCPIHPSHQHRGRMSCLWRHSYSQHPAFWIQTPLWWDLSWIEGRDKGWLWRTSQQPHPSNICDPWDPASMSIYGPEASSTAEPALENHALKAWLDAQFGLRVLKAMTVLMYYSVLIWYQILVCMLGDLC